MSKPKVEEQQPTAQEVAQFDIAQDKWANYQNTGVPIQNDYLQGINDQVVNGSVQTNAGNAMAAAQQQWKPMLNAQPDPNRGQNISLLTNKIGSDVGISAGAEFQQQSSYLGDLTQAANMGRTAQTPVLQSMGNLAGQASQQAQQDSQQAYQGTLANQNAFSGMVGAATPLLMNRVNPIAKDGSYLNGAYDNRIKSFLG